MIFYVMSCVFKENVKILCVFIFSSYFIFFPFWFSLTYPIAFLPLPQMVVASNLRLTFAGICGFGECFTLC